MKPFVLCVLPRPPHPTRDGLAIRNYHLLEALGKEFRVRAFALRDPERGYAGEAPDGVSVEEVPQAPRRTRRALAVAGSLLSGRPYSELLYRSRELERGLAAAVSAERPAWVLAHSYHVAPAALSAGAPVWIDFHNLDSEIWRRTAETAASLWARAFARAQARRVEALERELVRLADGVSCVSRRDAAALRALEASSDPLVVPNGVDLARYPFRSEAPSEETVFFVGDLTWPPNADGVRWLRNRVWPLLLRARPAVRAEILGRGAPPDLEALSGSEFVLLGEGSDTRPHWARAAVAVVPLLAGGGTRLKILEAAASGAPVVSTTVGAEGLDLVPDREILIRDGPDAFAAAVAQLLGSPEAARSQAAAARARVEALYDWKRIAPALARELARRAGIRA
jgi:glycosyltransferase involved in cell wall biosynthesis